MREVKIIEAGSENGAGKRGASLGPIALKLEAREQELAIFKDRIWEVVENQNHAYTLNHNTPKAKNIESLTIALKAVSEKVEKTLSDGYFPLIFSGDHSNAIGAVSGVKNYFADDALGLIWIDAHFDLHSPYTTPSGNMHGMAVNALIDKDNIENGHHQPAQLTEDLWDQLKKLGSHSIIPKILAKNIVYIGVRDFEEEEMALAIQSGIKFFTPEDILNKGIAAVINETKNYLSDCEKWYVSFDVDSLDTSISKGTGTPVGNGLSEVEAAQIFNSFFHHEKVVAFEITEINPLLDTENSMAKAVVRLLSPVL